MSATTSVYRLRKQVKALQEELQSLRYQLEQALKRVAELSTWCDKNGI